MRVYLIQHGKAKSKEEDPARGLTEEGREETRKIAGFFGKKSPEVYVVWHSGKQRARETAEILAEGLGIPRRIMEHSNLAPMDDVKRAARELEGMEHNVVVAGHLPFLSRLTGFLLTGNEEMEPLKFYNSGMVCIEKTETGWQLQWAVTPDFF
jgi:phosphohistidine phosphatase